MNLLKHCLLASLIGLSLTACSQGDDQGNTNNPKPGFSFAENDGSINLPANFKAVIVADNLGNARHITIRENGDVYVKLGSPQSGGAVVALRDEDGDGQADVTEYFASQGGTGIGIFDGYLYYSSNNQVFRKKFKDNELVPSGVEETIITVPTQSQHGAKSIAFDGAGNLYMNIGAPSNACQNPSRQPGVPGQDPCPLLDNYGGIWKFSATQLNQQFSDGTRYATGIRNAVGITWSPVNSTLYAMQHGRDQLSQFWPNLYTEQQNAEQPAEEMFEIQEGDDFGWPYCYYDADKNKKVLNPEYGGDGDKVGRCDTKEDPVMAFPGHWAPNAITFYNKSQFPDSYKNGAFIAFHGSWNRAPLPQQGYNVVFVPFENGKPKGNYEEFATEFANDGGTLNSPGDAEYRPCGVAVGPDGSLYICDSVKGRVWRVVYTGG